MIGPTEKSILQIVCTECECVITTTSTPTKRFPEKKTWHYCKHPDLSTQVAYIKGYPKTPKWCPATKKKED